MPEYDNLGAFIKDNKQVVKDYFETRLELYRLQGARQAAKIAGCIVWVMLALFLGFLFIIFGGITLGYWLSSLTGSYTAGFGLTALIVLLLIGLITALRKTLFISPVIRHIIRSMQPPGGESGDGKDGN